jgi:DNA-binding NarL/FixJ family response regulator
MLLQTSMHVFSVEEWSDLKRELSLSRRQADVVEQLLMGRTDKQIAYNLQMSISSVRTHLSKVFVRLGVADRCELIVYLFARSRTRHECDA